MHPVRSHFSPFNHFDVFFPTADFNQYHQSATQPQYHFLSLQPISPSTSSSLTNLLGHKSSHRISFGRGAKINTLSVHFTLKVFFGTRHNVPIPLYLPKLVCHNSQNPKVLPLLHFECFAIILEVFFSTRRVVPQFL